MLSNISIDVIRMFLERRYRIKAMIQGQKFVRYKYMQRY
jgi:hypothetical protein